MATQRKIYKAKLRKMNQFVSENCEEYFAKCEVLLDSVQSKNQNDILTNYRQILSFLHDSAGEIRKAITDITYLFLDDSSECETFRTKLDETECDRSREEYNFQMSTKEYKNWIVITKFYTPDAVSKLRRKPIEPWNGYDDERSAPIFLKEFSSKLRYYPDGSKVIRKFLSYLRDSDGKSFADRLDRNDTMETIAKKFYKEFADEQTYCHEIVEFTKAECPIPTRYDEEVFDFMRSWLDKFKYNPKVTMRWVARILAKKVPNHFSDPLYLMLASEEPLSWNIILKELKRYGRFKMPVIRYTAACEQQARANAEMDAQLETSSSEESD